MALACSLGTEVLGADLAGDVIWAAQLVLMEELPGLEMHITLLAERWLFTRSWLGRTALLHGSGRHLDRMRR